MKSEGTQRSFSRKRFLGRWAPAWGAVALDPRGRRRRAPCGRPASASRRPQDHFGRIFRLPPFAAQSPWVEAALIELGRAGGPPEFQ
jgi:hypothetical protein